MSSWSTSLPRFQVTKEAKEWASHKLAPIARSGDFDPYDYETRTAFIKERGKMSRRNPGGFYWKDGELVPHGTRPTSKAKPKPKTQSRRRLPVHRDRIETVRELQSVAASAPPSSAWWSKGSQWVVDFAQSLATRLERGERLTLRQGECLIENLDRYEIPHAPHLFEESVEVQRREWEREEKKEEKRKEREWKEKGRREEKRVATAKREAAKHKKGEIWLIRGRYWDPRYGTSYQGDSGWFYRIEGGGKATDTGSETVAWPGGRMNKKIIPGSGEEIVDWGETFAHPHPGLRFSRWDGEPVLLEGYND